jgi:hypothetical protein
MIMALALPIDELVIERLFGDVKLAIAKSNRSI